MISDSNCSFSNASRISITTSRSHESEISRLARLSSVISSASDASYSSESTSLTVLSQLHSQNDPNSHSDMKKKKKSRAPSKVKIPLPLDYHPSPFTVLCGRNRECFEWEGNQRFRSLCNSFMQDYLNCPGKLEKSRIVTKIMKTIRQKCRIGCFVSFENGRYYEYVPPVSQSPSFSESFSFYTDMSTTILQSFCPNCPRKGWIVLSRLIARCLPFFLQGQARTEAIGTRADVMQ